MKTRFFLQSGGLSAVNARLVLLLLCSLLAFTGAQAQLNVEPGVSQELAQYRAQHVSNVRYRLLFCISDKRDEPVTVWETIRFVWDGDKTADLQLDFQGKVVFAHVNNDRRLWKPKNEHIVIRNKYLKKGENMVTLSLECQDKALNRQDDYLYTLFVPDHARSVFACFDQPDIKARYDLTLELPKQWQAIANGELADSIDTYGMAARNGCLFNPISPKRRSQMLQEEWTDASKDWPKKLHFKTTEPLPTYLFSFVAGRFREEKAMRDGRELTALYRETDPQKVAQLPEIFDQVALSLRWMEDYTGIRQPFQKYGFVALPGYQFGGMEHPGCIQLKDNTLFLGPNPTPDERLNRLNLIAHETAHLWFGDLVTMRWFNDVWTKEVFANFMADKIAREQFPDINHNLSFIKAHYPLAMSTDRTLGTHPIQQPLANLNQAGLLYGNIIYHKAPIMMRKLEQQMGEAAFRRGLQTYLKRFSYGNATWDDLIDILEKEAPDAGIRAFDRLWVKQKGMPLVDAPLMADTLFNPTGMDYVRYHLADSTAVIDYLNRWDRLATEESRMGAAMTLYDNWLMHTATDGQAFTGLWMLSASERNELTLSLCAQMLASAVNHTREGRDQLERTLWLTAQKHPVQTFRQQLLRMLCTSAVAPDVCDSVYQLWKAHDHPLLNTRNYMATAYHLALVRPQEWQTILAEERARLQGADLRQEFDFVSRGCTPDTTEQWRLFEQLLLPENRAIEPYAAALLTLLNNQLREPQSNRMIRPALEALEEIQRTGDIFFPLNWCQALLGGHRSDEARHEVEHFLADHPDYPEPLRNKLLQAAFMLLNGQ